jgi:hypothetical protein
MRMMGSMDPTKTSPGNYTAKLTDGPLEGRTITRALLETGDPEARLEIPAEGAKRFAYVRSGGMEFSGEGDQHPTAVDYRYTETVFG